MVTLNIISSKIEYFLGKLGQKSFYQSAEKYWKNLNPISKTYSDKPSTTPPFHCSISNFNFPLSVASVRLILFPHQSNILTCVCFKAVGAPIGAEGARFTGDVKSIENGSCRWGDATRDVAAVRRRSSHDWSRWFDGWNLKRVSGKSCYSLSCKEETLVNFMATYLKAMYKHCAQPSATHHRRSRWRCAASP